jgi:hypothetical protein
MADDQAALERREKQRKLLAERKRLAAVGKKGV